ncbi:hypothetical protein AVEN_225396-1 [Araneus ventricosus]|uniref:Uncharacterized protein n=1 Tax=Araneus ventricosus TaxID=182803 RepID=A0A4Y2HX43_ARAVE|nr:hypothetical protein AVEN_225396-1 [Araneus ventricosus]
MSCSGGNNWLRKEVGLLVMQHQQRNSAESFCIRKGVIASEILSEALIRPDLGLVGAGGGWGTNRESGSRRRGEAKVDFRSHNRRVLKDPSDEVVFKILSPCERSEAMSKCPPLWCGTDVLRGGCQLPQFKITSWDNNNVICIGLDQTIVGITLHYQPGSRAWVHYRTPEDIVASDT